MELTRGDLSDRPKIVQCCREIAVGGGVSGVAAELEAGFLAAGYQCDRFTLESVGLTPHKRGASRFVNKIYLLRDVVWFSLAGTLCSKLRFSRQRDTVVISHNDIVHGDLYVNHGLHKLLVLQSPNKLRMLLRNPLHCFLLIREEIRHRLRVHRHIVTLSSADSSNVIRMYPATKGRLVELANGVHVERFASAALRREETRLAQGVTERDLVLLFVGHEYERKGLHLAFQALCHLDDRFRLWVVGGSESMVTDARSRAARLGVEQRVTFLGTVKQGVENYFGAADLFVLPSDYEAAALVLLEAMAAGAVPVVTNVGAAPDLIEPGINGFLVDRDAQCIAAAVTDAVQSPERLTMLSEQAKQTVMNYDWANIVDRYLHLIEEVHADRRKR